MHTKSFFNASGGEFLTTFILIRIFRLLPLQPMIDNFGMARCMILPSLKCALYVYVHELNYENNNDNEKTVAKMTKKNCK